jgi:hypothetical protein
MLGIAWPLEMCGRGHRGHMWNDADMPVKVIGSQDGENRWGMGILPKKGDSEHPHPILPGYWKCVVGDIQGTHGIRLICPLRW